MKNQWYEPRDKPRILFRRKWLGIIPNLLVRRSGTRRRIKWPLFNHSIFTKLLAVIILTGILVILLFSFFFQFHFGSRIKSEFNSNIRNYFLYMSKEIGTPPDTIIAKRISRQYSVGIKYQSEKFIWEVEVPDISKERHFFQFIMDFFKDREFTLQNIDGSRFIFNSSFHRSMRARPEEFLLLLFLVLLIFTFSYILIKKILQPVKALSRGVKELSNGNFSYEIPIVTKDELASLSKSFNEMTSKIKEMISSRDQLLLDVSHELRTPLTRMKLALEFMNEEKIKESISADIKEIEIMIGEILESERLKNSGTIKSETNNLNELLREIVLAYEKEKTGIELENEHGEIFLQFNYPLLKIAIKNIVDNAIKFSAPDGEPILISLKETDEEVTLKIIDKGIGIPEENLPFIFESFYRADRSRSKKPKGFGLGLGLSKKIIEAHGGEINISNNVSRGITVTIKLKKI